MPEAGRRRVLVLSQGRSRGALAAVRALGRAGWWVEVGTPDGGGMVGASRWVRAGHRVARPRRDDRAFVRDVTAALTAGRHDLVFGGADDWMAALAHHRDELPGLVAHPDADVVDRALDKLEVARLAAAHGVPTPRTVCRSTDVDWPGAVVVKARRHWHHGLDRAVRLEAVQVADRQEAARCAEQAAASGVDVVHQQPVEGSLMAVVGVFDGARLHGTVQQVAEGTWPWPHGVSSRARTVASEPRVVQPLEALLADLGWHGLVEVQYLRDARGTAHLIDVNGRFYGSLALALASGPNLADAWARLVLDGAVPPLPPGRAGVRYSWVAGDLRRAVAERRGGLVRDLGASVLGAVRASTRSVVQVADPGPAAHLALGLLGRRPRPATPPRHQADAGAGAGRTTTATRRRADVPRGSAG